MEGSGFDFSITQKRRRRGHIVFRTLKMLTPMILLALGALILLLAEGHRDAAPLASVASSSWGGAIANGAATAQRVRAVDGDTLAIGRERVRIDGLDAPEAGERARCPREAALAQRATQRMAELAEAGVTIERRGLDRYGRTLAVVRDRQGRDVADLLVNQGLAAPYHGRGKRRDWCAT